MIDPVHEWRLAAYKATRERDEARADLEKWDDLRAETHERMRADLTELIQSKWDAELCDPDAAMAADTVLDYLENDFAGQLARMQQRAEQAEATVRRVQAVATPARRAGIPADYYHGWDDAIAAVQDASQPEETT
jgi:hypothetical protein